jgi:hypothetical protein
MGITMSLSKKQGIFSIHYREVQSDDELEEDVIDEKEEVESIRSLLKDVRSGVDEQHKLESLDVSSFFLDWVKTVLANSDALSDGVNHDVERTLDYLAEDFSDSMLSRARERGKYVVLIVSEDSLIACHSFTGKKALTTDMDVIEELLSESNIDKFAEFTYDQDGDVIVKHFDRNDTQSFTEWLGIPEDEIAFDIKGDVRIYTKIDDIDAVFEFDEDAITTKLLGSDDYDLADGLLKTPNEKARTVDKIRWGHESYSNVSSFKQDLFKVTHNLTRATELYDGHISDSLDSFFDVIDQQDRIVKDKKNSTEEINKPQVENFELVYVNQSVQMDISWRNELARGLFSDRDPLPIFHAGGQFTENPVHLGNYRIYNDIGLTDAQSSYIEDLVTTADDLGTANLRPLFSHITFELLAETTSKPVKYMFQEFSEEFRSKFIGTIDDGDRITQTEGEEIGLEWKSPPWYDRQAGIEDLATGIHREFQSARLLLLGINEDAKNIDVIDSGVSDEEANEVEHHLQEEHGMTDIHVWPITIGEGHALIALNVESKDSPFKGDISILDPEGGES